VPGIRPLSTLLLCAFASTASAGPLLFFNFNESGTAAVSSGTAPGQTLNMYYANTPTTIALADLHTGPGTGVAGDIVGSPLYGVDRAFNASGGIAVNETSTAISGLTSWTVSGWYKPTSSLVAGSAFFQTPGDNSMGSSGFSIRANNGNNLRVGVAPSMVSTTTNSFDPLNEWVFFAVSYDGTQKSNNVKVYEGFRNAAEAAAAGQAMSVTLVSTLTLNQGTPVSSVGYSLGARLNSSNYGPLSNPSIIQSMPALFDNFRVDSGALGQAALEAYRAADVALAPNTYVWSGTSGSSWEYGSNWASNAGGVPDGAPACVIFGAAGTAGSAVLSSSHTLGSLTFMGTVATTISGSGTLTLAGTSGPATITASGTNAINSPVALNGDASVSTASGSQLTIGGSTGGSGGLTAGGGGRLTLAGSNCYAGATLVSGGTLQLGNSNALGSGGLVANAGVVDLNGQSIAVASLAGSAGTVTDNSTGGGTTTLTLSGTGSGSFGGALLDGPGQYLGLVLSVAGTQILTGSNAYSGGTTINPGATLQVGNGGAAGSIPDAGVANNGTLAFNRSGTVAIGGPITGSGGLLQTGPGNLILGTGAGQYSGGTTVSGGTLSFYKTSLPSGGAVTVDPGAGNTAGLTWLAPGFTPLDPTSNGMSLTLSSGTAVFNFGNTVLVLNGTIGGTGGMEVAGGILQLGNDSPSGGLGGVSSVQLDAGSTLLFNRNDGYGGPVGAAIGGPGSVQQDDGLLVLTGSNTYTGGTVVSSGTLQLGDLTLAPTSGSAGSGPISLAWGTLLAVARNDDLTLSGTITGQGGLTKAGAGTLTLANTGNAYRGGTTLSQGSIDFVSAGLGSGAVRVDPGAGNTSWLIWDQAGGPNATDLTAWGSGTHSTGRLTLASGTAGLDLGGQTVVFGDTTGTSPSGFAINGTANLSIANGTLALGDNLSGTSGLGNLASVALVSRNGGNSGYLCFQGTSSPTVAVPISGSGGLIQAGSDTLTLTASNSYSGGTSVTSGTLVLENASALAAGSLLTIGAQGSVVLGSAGESELGYAGGGAFLAALESRLCGGAGPGARDAGPAAPATGGASAVPEPAAVVLLAGGGLFGLVLWLKRNGGISRARPHRRWPAPGSRGDAGRDLTRKST
jgi:autotransporter-associated beta strand protein